MKPSERYNSLLEEIEKLKSIYGISYDIEVVVVTKYATVEDIQELLCNAAVKHVGENRVQEAEKKFQILSNKNLIDGVKKHMLGPVQTNKLAKVTRIFDVVQSVEDTEIPKGLIKRGFKGEMLLEIKTSYEETKHGIEVEEAEELFQKLLDEGILVSGLMTISPLTDDKKTISKSFKTLRALKERIESSFKVTLKYLSMGMTNDYKIAIEEGSNMLRIGSLIFK
ncbi:MAG: YggS family pyridoxal phosphate-dependent enzyme [Brevinematales bacterium]|nr:YggS family pyridoxal phosphate-dependent enzyme [Brevinematales bacterium]